MGKNVQIYNIRIMYSGDDYTVIQVQNSPCSTQFGLINVGFYYYMGKIGRFFSNFTRFYQLILDKSRTV